MNIKNLFEKMYLARKMHIFLARRKIKNKDFSLLASNCIGGVIYNNLGLKFLSPTINLQIYSNDFIKFVLNLDKYLNEPINFVEPDNGIPVGMLDDIMIHFTHYRNNEEAAKKWEERKKRINKDNLYVILNDRDGVTEEQIRALSALDCKNICVFSSKKYNDLPYVYYLPKYQHDKCVGNLLKRSKLTGLREFEKCFDYVAWLNSSL